MFHGEFFKRILGRGITDLGGRYSRKVRLPECKGKVQRDSFDCDPSDGDIGFPRWLQLVFAGTEGPNSFSAFPEGCLASC